MDVFAVLFLHMCEFVCVCSLTVQTDVLCYVTSVVQHTAVHRCGEGVSATCVVNYKYLRKVSSHTFLTRACRKKS